MIKFLKTKLGISLSAVVLVVLVISLFYIFKSPAPLVTITARKGDIAENISVTGSVTSAENVDLAFQRSGQVAWVTVEAGARVRAGQVLMSLNIAELNGQRQLQRARVNEAQARLDQLVAGASVEDIKLAETAVTNAKQSVIDKLQDGYTKAEDAIHNKADQFFFNPRSINPQLKLFPVVEGNTEYYLQSTRLQFGSAVFPAWQKWLGEVNLTGDFSVYLNTETSYLNQVKLFLDTLGALVNNANTYYLQDYLITVEMPSTLKIDIATARANVNTALSNLVAVQGSLKTAQDQLALKQAPPTSESRAIYQAQLDQAKANLAVIEAQIAQNVIVSPVAGVITAVNFKRGETATVGVAAVAVFNDARFEIDANIPETDIGKVSVGDLVDITIDAFAGEEFTGKVARTDPGKQIVDGVVNYKVVIIFDKLDPRFKDGLTANLEIQVAQKSGVVILPQVAILENDEGTFVKKISGDKTTQEPVTVGMRAKNGDVEVISGVVEGEVVENIGIKK